MVLLGLAGCSTSIRDRCEDIELGTSAATLPGGGYYPYFIGYDDEPLHGPVSELSCCRGCSPDMDCGCGVDCREYRAEPVALVEEFQGTCENDGRSDRTAFCAVWVADGRVVGTEYFCENRFSGRP